MAVAQQQSEQLAVLFHAPAGLKIPARLVEVGDGGVIVELSQDTWSTVDILGLFHLQPTYRLAGQLTGNGPVRLELWRFPDTDRSDPAELRDRLVSSSIDDVGNDLLDTENWYAITVTEETYRYLDDERSAEPIRLSSGFATRWRTVRPTRQGKT